MMILAIEGGVYVTEHELALELVVARLHVKLVKLPPAPPSLQDTVPVGADGKVVVSVTMATNAIVFPITAEDGFGEVVVVVVCRLVTVRTDVAALPECVTSPK